MNKNMLTASGDIEGGSSGTIKFNPEDVQDEEYRSLYYTVNTIQLQ